MQLRKTTIFWVNWLAPEVKGQAKLFISKLHRTEIKTQNARVDTSGEGLKIPCQYLNFMDIQDMIELYTVSYWFARSKHNIP